MEWLVLIGNLIVSSVCPMYKESVIEHVNYLIKDTQYWEQFRKKDGTNKG